MARPTVAILAGGHGKRLGGPSPKALASLGPGTLLERAVATARSMSDEVLVVAPSRLGLIHPGARAVEDLLPDTGPLSGVVAGLEAAGTDIVVLLGVDLPLVPPDLLRALAAELAASGEEFQAAVPRPGGRPQPLAAAYRRSAAASLRRALDSGERSLVRAVQTLAVAWIDDARIDELPGGRDALLNVNAPEDLERARARLSEPDRSPS
jgi:molybdopterin-guanine dinucleotide biosynthesis protein A